MRFLVPALLLATVAAPPLAAQNSQPVAATPREAPIPARDIPYPGVLTLEVDATDTARNIFSVRQTIPVAQAGTLTLRYPRWLPGNHAPSGPIEAITGMTFTAAGRPLVWRRDPGDMYAFQVEVPRGVRTVEARFAYLSDNAGAIGRTEMTPVMLNLQWEKMSLYPAGHYVRQIRIRPSVILPDGWTGISAVDGEPRRAGQNRGRIDYPETDYETLVDSPMFAGLHFRAWNLAPNVDLNVVADRPGDLEASEEQIAAHRRMVEQLIRLYGTRSFNRYDFLFALSDELGGIGLEHHRSSENAVPRGYFTGWATGAAGRGLLPHEMNHSWNGKHRRPADLWTPDYNMPMQNSLLWVYEGQTSYWDVVVAARSGLVGPEIALGEIANTAAYTQVQRGREWRSLLDTTNQPALAYRVPQDYPTQQRGTDYYNEGALIWLEADMLIRTESGGRRSLDDFARSFFGGREGDWGVRTYTLDDVVAAMNAVHPHDWAGFFRARVDQPGAPAAIRGITLGGYRLVFRSEPNAYDRSRMSRSRSLDLSHSLGFTVAASGRVGGVIWGGPAYEQAIRPGTTILAVDGADYSEEGLRAAIIAAQSGRRPINLTIRDRGRVRNVAIDYRGGLRFPHLERIGSDPAPLDRLLEPLP